MILSPEVYNKIKSVVFTRLEPSVTNVFWAKPSDPEGEGFSFYVYDNGAWQSLSEYENVIIPEVDPYLSAFINDVGFYVIPIGGIPLSDLSSEVQAALETAASAYVKPTTGIPASDLAEGVIPDVSGKAEKSEMSVSTNEDTTTITLKSGLSASVLNQHQNISGKEDKADIVSASGATLTAEVGKYYTLSSVGTLAITLPTIASGTTKVQTVTFYIAAGSTPAVTFTSTHSIYYSDGFEIAADTTYEISAAYNGIAWVVASVKIVIPT